MARSKAPSKTAPAAARRARRKESLKVAALEPFYAGPGGALTTNQGAPIADDQNSLRAGERGPSLLEDFILREKITHFDHERIPERVVHARGTAAHGYFQVYESMAPHTKAAFLQDPSVRTPVFVRFSTVGGSRGSADTARDVRGFAVRFYTPEGNYDIVGNNMPVFFIQDAIKFPDFVHALKPEPHNEIPQASSAHDTFWDFVSLTPESTHTVMWLMSDRALPRSYAMMEGFGVHTFRFINAQNDSRFVKFHWKPILGAHSLVWDEAQKLMGKDPDFNRRDLFESIERGQFPEWELGVQMFGDAEADAFDFDILDPTKLIPEELIPVTRIGKLVLDRNPDNYFAETEQVAFCTTHLVPGIGFTNDPLLQGRTFSYLDTQLTRLGGPNFHEIPINRPVCPFANGQRDGFHRIRIDTGNTAYGHNSLDGDLPKERPSEEGGFETFPARIEGVARRIRAESFKDHFSQATIFWNSMSEVEKAHIVDAFSFELSKVVRPAIRHRVLSEQLAHVDAALANAVAANLGLPAPVARATNGKAHAKGRTGTRVAAAPSLSLLNPAVGVPGNIATRKIAILAAEGVNVRDVNIVQEALRRRGAQGLVLAARLGELNGEGGSLTVDHALVTMPSVVFDGLVIPGGRKSADALRGSGDVLHFVAETFKHAKPICLVREGVNLFAAAGLPANSLEAEGVASGEKIEGVLDEFLAALGRHRAWSRSKLAEAVAG
jgi:catalase